MLVNGIQDGQHGNVRLSGSGRSADEQIVLGLVGFLEDDRLDCIQFLKSLESQLANLDISFGKNNRINTSSMSLI